MKYLWDTNIAIYYLQEQFPLNAEKFIDHIIKEEQPALSVISEIELYCWKTATEEDLKVLHRFINEAVVIELTQAIKMKTAEIRKAIRIKLPDAIIAATALEYDCTLLSRNLSDFSAIDKLRIINPWDQ
ncbi:MAG TPA: type II toxin-antitoxin system VapC family toxin [Hanamia sp.]